MPLSCGIDVGGTKIAGAVVDDDGRILHQQRVESPAQDVEAMADAIARLVAEIRRTHDVTHVGIGAAGYVGADRATVFFAPNLAWRDLDLRGQIEPRVGLPVVVENDAASAAWAEFRFGAGIEADSMLMVTVGTGVGGGIVADGRLFRGSFGVAGEIGHYCVSRGGRRCGCGQHGCLEPYASGSALVRNAQQAVRAGEPGIEPLRDRAGGDIGAITGPMITELARGGDKFCVAMFDEIGTWLGVGLASLASVLDPELIVIGGGVSAAGDLLLEPTRTSYQANLTGRGHRPEATVRLAQLGNDAGVIGAADLARR